jgi:hypothetical protein
VCGRDDGKRSSNVTSVFAEGWCGVDISDDMKEHREGINVARLKEMRTYIRQDNGCSLTVACLEENLNMFPGCFYSVCMGASPSRTRFEYRADCNRDRLHPNLSLSRVAV